MKFFAVRRVRVRLDNDGTAITAFPGQRGCLQQGPDVTFEYAGPLPELLAWLASQKVLDLRIEPLGLAGIYHRFHGTEA